MFETAYHQSRFEPHKTSPPPPILFLQYGGSQFYCSPHPFCPQIMLLNPYQILFKHDVRESVHHSTIHKEKPNKMQQCIKILFHIYVKLNMFRATHRPSSGA